MTLRLENITSYIISLIVMQGKLFFYCNNLHIKALTVTVAALTTLHCTAWSGIYLLIFTKVKIWLDHFGSENNSEKLFGKYFEFF